MEMTVKTEGRDVLKRERKKLRLITDKWVWVPAFILCPGVPENTELQLPA